MHVSFRSIVSQSALRNWVMWRQIGFIRRESCWTVLPHCPSSTPECTLLFLFLHHSSLRTHPLNRSSLLTHPLPPFSRLIFAFPPSPAAFILMVWAEKKLFLQLQFYNCGHVLDLLRRKCMSVVLTIWSKLKNQKQFRIQYRWTSSLKSMGIYLLLTPSSGLFSRVYNLDAGICCHSATRALVRLATDAGW